MAQSSPSFLAVLIDCDSLLSYLSLRASTTRSDGGVVNINSILQSIVVYIHTFAILHRENHLVVLAHGLSGVHAVLPDLTSQSSDPLDFIPWLPSIGDQFMMKMAKVIDMEKLMLTSVHSGAEPKRNLAAAMSTALAIIRQRKSTSSLQARILALQFDKDHPQNYNAVMNCVFRYQQSLYSARQLD